MVFVTRSQPNGEFPMTRIACLAGPAVVLALCLPVVPANAQLSRTFVSAATGNDANNCDRPTPCRTFQGAHDKTNPDGEITVLDAGGYGSVKITKSISIVNDGVGEASTLVSGGATGITVDAGAAGYVNLRGITVQGIGFGGGFGLKLLSAFSLTISKCVFRNHTGEGIDFNVNGQGTVSAAIVDTLVADNGGIGIFVRPTAPFTNVQVSLDRVAMYGNSFDGLSVDGGANPGGVINVSVVDSISAHNGGDGFQASTNSSGKATTLMLMHSVAANNKGAGLSASGAVLRVGQSMITGNATTWVSFGGVLQSFGDNYIAGNFDGDPPPPAIARK